ncbi:hypothetical protein RBSH_02210 [Rhodopirellula baltica SH28]|uniref:Uncharacterized protein n=1 Tax=Rhodopirellula baltica SH28 TaxID=993517 RepID=K5D747_RHOBT|nr:hypothetical protein RBSH_02210 [Rhodopirellula baltica SH28]
MNLSVCRDDGSYAAGCQLKAGWRISRVELEELQSVEISVLWHTEGKGDEDLGVHHFQRYDRSDLERLPLNDRHEIQCVLPASPLSYQGHLMQIHWKIRVRVFLADGREIVAEQPFYLVTHQPDSNQELITDPVPFEDRPDPPQRRSLAAKLPSVISRLRGRRSQS